MSTHSRATRTVTPALEGLLLSEDQVRFCSLGGCNIRQQTSTKVYQAVQATRDRIFVGRAEVCDTCTTFQNSSRRYTTNSRDGTLKVLVLERGQTGNMVVSVLR
ncbi:uncharacterized protein V6R79_004096 [Siganus canaliculatus]